MSVRVWRPDGPLVGDSLETVLGTYLFVSLNTSVVVVVHLLSCSLFLGQSIAEPALGEPHSRGGLDTLEHHTFQLRSHLGSALLKVVDGRLSLSACLTAFFSHVATGNIFRLLISPYWGLVVVLDLLNDSAPSAAFLVKVAVDRRQ